MGRACTWHAGPVREHVSVSPFAGFLPNVIRSGCIPVRLLLTASATDLVPLSDSVVGLVKSLPRWDIVLAVKAWEARESVDVLAFGVAVRRHCIARSWCGAFSGDRDVPGTSGDGGAHLGGGD